MLNRISKILIFLSLIILFSTCGKDDDDVSSSDTEVNLIFKFKFDDQQVRLNNFGNPAVIADGNAAQSPKFNEMSAHYLELAPSKYTLLGNGEIVYQGEETTAGGNKAVDFSKAKVVDEGETFLSIPIKDIAAGEYEWIRLSLTYQNFEIDFSAQGFDLTGTLSSFVGYNTYIGDHKIRNKTINVNDDKLQGFWAFETHDENLPFEIPTSSGESAQTTVPNPLFDSSPIPPGSCVVTGEFPEKLTITGNEQEDVVVILSVTTNNSFEWKDLNNDGKYDPADGEQVVDMGLRGLVPMVE